MNSRISEERDRDYLPLTDEEREELTDEQEEQWEETAKTGLLRSDTLLTGIVSSMRSSLASIVSNTGSSFNSMASIGITTGDYTEKGKLYIDEDKLKEAISSDPDAVMNLFTTSSEVAGEEGLAVRVYDSLNSGINQLISKAGLDSSYSIFDNSTLGEKITDYEEQIDTWDDRLQEMEDRYYTQFTALETALYSMSQQSSWITQMLSGE